jgi:hypothetical protein
MASELRSGNLTEHPTAVKVLPAEHGQVQGKRPAHPAQPP